MLGKKQVLYVHNVIALCLLLLRFSLTCIVIIEQDERLLTFEILIYADRKTTLLLDTLSVF